MRLTVFVLASAVASASASRLFPRQSYPSCALPCLASADFAGCDSSDLTCLCNSSTFVDSTTECIAGACSGDDLTQADNAAVSECEAVGVTLTSTPASSSTAAASSSAAGSASASTTSGSSSASSTSTAAASTSSSSSARNNAAVNVLAGAAALGVAVLAL
ncbi:uncharacterized protein STEHIDRAFT_120844 [Stereum hirsutum FP-91666 SS1]|uniref:uncharacterized protein n=1 Tax=Stereum hirsutum (strain FP-91666) TaxID=721885 RepID=UPI000440B337|nr:uncharacterized protein STEHIDRAFT_120844 [Stereum hirsutum FP-91666 SS1]EIM87111.1 hypothetical protein STEHIDRAFT_120844 [Stereum hirsutum FP-91666 SS1]